jgi:hypothetical protein
VKARIEKLKAFSAQKRNSETDASEEMREEDRNEVGCGGRNEGQVES